MGSYSCPHCGEAFEADASPDDIIYCPHCNETVSLPEDEELPPGTILGGFEVLSVLGTGGMGNVYLAKQLSMDRDVALKVLPRLLTRNTELVDQFLNEAKMTARLEHHNIVTAIDAGNESGTYYLAP